MIRTTPLKRFVDPQRPITYGIVQAGEDVEGGVPYIRPVDMPPFARDLDPSTLRTTTREIAAAYRRSTVSDGDLVVSIGPSYGKLLVVSARLAGSNLTQGTARVAPRQGVEVRFLQWALAASPARAHWDAVVGGATFGGLNLGPLSMTPVPAVDAPDQVAIADFLDRECARIAQAVDAVREQAASLDVYRQSVVRDAVAGLPPVPMKFGYRVVDCKHRTPEYLLNGYPVVSTREVLKGALQLTTVDRFVGAEDYADMRGGGRDPRVGDIIYSRNASVGIAAYLSDPVEVAMGQDVVLITRRPRDCELLMYILNYAVADQVARLSVGSTFSRINVPVIRSLVVPSGDSTGEARALAIIKSEFARVADIEAEMRWLETRLAEYREALITEAVTGQIDVTRADVAA